MAVCCSERGYRLIERLAQRQEAAGWVLDWVLLAKGKSLEGFKSRMPMVVAKGSLADAVGEWFQRVDAILFVCAAGIAVRCVAPYLKHKSVDPAVLVMDETGRFCISLLSGHAGGANELAERIAGFVGACPVVTTATDRSQVFAVDEFARKNGLVLTDWDLAKEISASLLAGKEVGFASDLPVQGRLPKGLVDVAHAPSPSGRGKPPLCIQVSHRKLAFREGSLALVPQDVVLGLGCRKMALEQEVENAVFQALEEAGIRKEALSCVASIDLKKEEAGILAFCKKHGLSFRTFPAQELQRLKGDFTESAFVKQVTGVGNVCERSAVAAGGELFFKKRAYGGVTVALAVEKRSVTF